MSDDPEALAALERLYARQTISLEEGQTAARLITKNEAYVFPAPPVPRAPPAQKAEAPTAAEANTDAPPPGSTRDDQPSG